RHLQRGEDPPVLGEAARLEAAATTSQKIVSVPAEHPIAIRCVPAGVLPCPRARRRKPALLASAAVGADVEAETILLGRCAGRAGRLQRVRRSRVAAAGGICDVASILS